MNERPCRVWDKQEKTMTFSFIGTLSSEYRDEERYLVMSYLMRDKEGVWLYDGDIVRSDTGKVFEIGKFLAKMPTLFHRGRFSKEIKLIGNAWEHQELVAQAIE